MARAAAVVALRDLDPDESRDYCEGPASMSRPRAVAEVTRSPAGALAARRRRRAWRDSPPDPLTPDLVGVLVQRFVDLVPSVRAAAPLECALARVTTEALLRDTLALQDALERLGGCVICRSSRRNRTACCSRFARDIPRRDLRWHDPDGYKQRFRAVAATCTPA